MGSLPQKEKLGSAIPEHFPGVPVKTHSLIWAPSVYLITQISELWDAEPS